MTATNATVIRRLALQAKGAGMDIAGPGGLLKQNANMVIE